MTKKIYVVTELAGPKVAGQLVEKGAEIPLTEAEASGELLAGAIVEKGKQLHRAFTEPTRKAEAALEGATPPPAPEPEPPAPSPATPAAAASEKLSKPA